MVEQYATWCTYVLYAASFSCLFYVLTFRLINKSQTVLTLYVMFMSDDQLRLPLIITPIYYSNVFCIFCGSEGGVMNCVWKDNRFLFSMYSERVKFN